MTLLFYCPDFHVPFDPNFEQDLHLLQASSINYVCFPFNVYKVRSLGSEIFVYRFETLDLDDTKLHDRLIV